TIQAKVVTGGAWGAPPTITVDSTTGFAVGDVVVLSTVSTASNPVGSGTADIATFDACALRIASLPLPPGGAVVFETPARGGGPDASHCTPASPSTMVYKFVAHAYRIDTSTPARAAVGPLQQSSNGGLLGAADSWVDLAYGFTDIQTALRMYVQSSTSDLDGD